MKRKIKEAMEWAIAYVIAGLVILFFASPYIWIIYDALLKDLF